MISKLNITITKTAQGVGEYVQIMSDDSISVNVVLVAGEIEVQDHRPAAVIAQVRAERKRRGK